jgi:hypothetical protein
MIESGYYPPGAENDPRAPWNQSDPQPVSQDIDYSCTMCRTANVETTDYDFSETDWLGEYKEQYRTPLQLIELLHDIATCHIDGRTPNISIREWKEIAADCKDWEIDEENTEEV